MNRRTALPAAAAFLMFGWSTMAFARVEMVEISGRMVLDELTLADALLVVEVDDAQCVPFELEADGRFRFKVPLGSKACLRFEKPGYLTKSILVDTRNALLTDEARKKNKHVRFDVRMSPSWGHEHLCYAGPVGSISFLKGSGLMKVLYDRSLATTCALDSLAADGPMKDREEER